MEDHDIEEIKRQHLSMMNSLETDYPEELHSTDKTLLATPNTVHHEQIIFFEGDLIKVNEKYLQAYGNFLSDWKEYQSEGTLFWYNEKINRSVWDNPTFVLIALLENKVDQSWNLRYWKGKDESHIEIKFSNQRKLYINRVSRKIAYSIEKPKPIEEKIQEIPDGMISGQKYIKQYVLEKVRDKFNEGLEKQNEEESEEERETINNVGQDIEMEIHSKERVQSNESNLEKIENSNSIAERKFYLDSLKENFDKEIGEFRQMLQEKNISLNSTYQRELPKIMNDPRFNNLPQDFRKRTFDEYIKDILPKQRHSSVLERKKNQEELNSLLNNFIERGVLTLKTTFAEFNLFLKDNEVWKKNLEMDREFLFKESKLRIKRIQEEAKNKGTRRFKQLLSELNLEEIDENTTYKDIKMKIKTKQEYKEVESKTERKAIIDDFLKDALKRKNDKKILESKMKNETFKSEEERERMKKKLENEIAVETLTQFLEDRIKNEISWEETINKLKNESLWKNSPLSEDQKKEIFKDFIHNLKKKKRAAFKILLAEKIQLNHEMTWHDAQHIMQTDTRFKEVNEKDREELFNRYMEYVQEEVVREFQRLLDESTFITKDSPTEGPAFKDLITRLNSDLRAQRLSRWIDKRDKLIRAKIKSLRYAFDKRSRNARIDNIREKFNK